LSWGEATRTSNPGLANSLITAIGPSIPLLLGRGRPRWHITVLLFRTDMVRILPGSVASLTDESEPLCYLELSFPNVASLLNYMILEGGGLGPHATRGDLQLAASCLVRAYSIKARASIPFSSEMAASGTERIRLDASDLDRLCYPEAAGAVAALEKESPGSTGSALETVRDRYCTPTCVPGLGGL